MVMTHFLKPAPKSGAVACDLLNQQVNQTADQQQRQANINQHPDDHHQSQSWLLKSVAHHGFSIFTNSNFVQHDPRILGS